MKFKLQGFPLYVLYALAGLAVIVGAVLYFNRGSQIRLEGHIQKVRTVATDEKNSVAVIDFRFVNPANYPFVVRSVQIVCEGKDGEPITSEFASAGAVDSLFRYKALELGPKYNDTLRIKSRVEPGRSLDAMAAGAFAVPEDVLKQRKRFVVRIEELDGAVAEIAETR